MMYRNFAIATLLAAPLIVVAVQRYLPVTPADPGRQAGSGQAAGSSAPAPASSAISPSPSAPPPPAAFVTPMPAAGMPLAGAGQPMLLPDQSGARAPVATDARGNPYSTPQQAPAGSPNAEY